MRRESSLRMILGFYSNENNTEKTSRVNDVYIY